MTTDWGIQRCKTALSGLLPKRLDGQRRRQQPAKIHCDVVFDTSAMSLITRQTRPKRQKKELFQVKKKRKKAKQTDSKNRSLLCFPARADEALHHVPDDIAADGSTLELMRLALLFPVRCRSRATVSHSPCAFDKEFSPEGNEKSRRFPMCAWPALLSGRDLQSMHAPQC